jgi:hypothetical protein
LLMQDFPVAVHSRLNTPDRTNIVKVKRIKAKSRDATLPLTGTKEKNPERQAQDFLLPWILRTYSIIDFTILPKSALFGMKLRLVKSHIHLLSVFLKCVTLRTGILSEIFLKKY